MFLFCSNRLIAHYKCQHDDDDDDDDENKKLSCRRKTMRLLRGSVLAKYN